MICSVLCVSVLTIGVHGFFGNLHYSDLNPKIDSPPFAATVAASAPQQHRPGPPTIGLLLINGTTGSNA